MREKVINDYLFLWFFVLAPIIGRRILCSNGRSYHRLAKGVKESNHVTIVGYTVCITDEIL